MPREQTIIVDGEHYKLAVRTPMKSVGIAHTVYVDGVEIGKVQRAGPTRSRRFSGVAVSGRKYAANTMEQTSINMAYGEIRASK